MLSAYPCDSSKWRKVADGVYFLIVEDLPYGDQCNYIVCSNLEEYEADLILHRVKTYPKLFEACRTVLAKTDVATRWPCPDCGRHSPSEGKRILNITQEDGTNILTGCWLCNTDELRDQIRSVIKEAFLGVHC